MMDDSTVIWLEVRSWNGLSIGAIHFYGTLKGQYRRGEEIDVTKILTTEEAKWMSRSDDWHYKAGDTSSRFEDFDALLDHAKEQVFRNFPQCRLLIQGDKCVAQPVLTVWCSNSEDLERMNKLYQEGVDLCDWDWDKSGCSARLDQVSKEWCSIAIPYGWEERKGDND